MLAATIIFIAQYVHTILCHSTHSPMDPNTYVYVYVSSSLLVYRFSLYPSVKICDYINVSVFEQTKQKK